MLSSQANQQRRQLARSIQGAQPQSRYLRPAPRPVARCLSERLVAVSGRPPTLLQLLRLGLHRTAEFRRTPSVRSRSTRTTPPATRFTSAPASRTARVTRRPASVSTSLLTAARTGRSLAAVRRRRLHVRPALGRGPSRRAVRSAQRRSIQPTPIMLA